MKLAYATLAGAALLVASCGTAVALAQERAITKQVLVKAPVEAVWQAWTCSPTCRSASSRDRSTGARGSSG